MKKSTALQLVLFLLVVWCPAALAQAPAPAATPAESPKKQHVAQAPATDAQKNIQAYIELLRSNVRQQKAETMGVMMQLSADDAAKFWPIYSEYNTELTKVNNLRVANIQEYAKDYPNMTDAKADELIQNAFEYRKQRGELLVKYYGQVKQSLGSITAARFLQVEDQLLLIIDLQIDSSLPIVGE
jgi:hypothetical protein